MQRLTPYLFFIVAALALGMVALDTDKSWQAEEVDVFDAVLITAGVLIGAHILRWLVGRLYANWKNQQR